ncbi:unnamed protein product [Cyprideis torosa]|uniref:Uncharacterized protein n=1 Tax=Cyprideis torosa TaxID=163714 RepID=A0A7R8W1L1_9CRUS|nr:unnamed protein product [Cyprideis torosa]CAG0881057.1 unnamed protein product [Cyprideis torosa]
MSFSDQPMDLAQKSSSSAPRPQLRPELKERVPSSPPVQRLPPVQSSEGGHPYALRPTLQPVALTAGGPHSRPTAAVRLISKAEFSGRASPLSPRMAPLGGSSRAPPHFIRPHLPPSPAGSPRPLSTQGPSIAGLVSAPSSSPALRGHVAPTFHYATNLGLSSSRPQTSYHSNRGSPAASSSWFTNHPSSTSFGSGTSSSTSFSSHHTGSASIVSHNIPHGHSVHGSSGASVSLSLATRNITTSASTISTCQVLPPKMTIQSSRSISPSAAASSSIARSLFRQISSMSAVSPSVPQSIGHRPVHVSLSHSPSPSSSFMTSGTAAIPLVPTAAPKQSPLPAPQAPRANPPTSFRNIFPVQRLLSPTRTATDVRSTAETMTSPRPSILRRRDSQSTSEALSKRSLPLSPGKESSNSSTLSATSSQEERDAELAKQDLLMLEEEMRRSSPSSARRMISLSDREDTPSPRKKPRKQLLQERVDAPLPPHADDDSGDVTTVENFVPIKRLSLLTGYRCNWKGKFNHFVRRSDIKPDPPIPHISDLLKAKKDMNREVRGWKIHYVMHHFKEISLSEEDYGQDLRTMTQSNTLDTALPNRIQELIKGNVLRTASMQETMTDTSALLDKLLECSEIATDIVNRATGQEKQKKVDWVVQRVTSPDRKSSTERCQPLDSSLRLALSDNREPISRSLARESTAARSGTQLADSDFHEVFFPLNNYSVA